MKAHDLARLLLSMPDVDVIIPNELQHDLDPNMGQYTEDLDIELRDDLHVDQHRTVYNDADVPRRKARIKAERSTGGYATDEKVTKIVIY